MTRKLLLCFIGMIILQKQTTAQVQVVSIDRIIQGSRYYSFPFIKFTDITVADKINEYLQSTVLENDVPQTDTGRIFEKARYNDEDSLSEGTFTGIGYKIEVNTPTILSLFFSMETMGAYSSYATSYYNFDTRNGGLLTIKNIITPTGIEVLKRRLIKEREKRISEWKTEMKKQKYGDAEDMAMVTEQFKICNEEASVENFFIKHDSILFYKKPCLPHVAAAFETNLDIKISFKELEKYFSEAGQKRLLPNKRRGRLDDLRDEFQD